MTTPYTPNTGSVAALTCRYFLKNPSEELSAFDIGEKFGEATSQVSYRLARAIETGLLVRAHSSDGEVMYGPGPDIDRLAAAADFHQTPQTTATMPAKQLPARPVKPASRGAAKGEDYTTPYKPPLPAGPLPEPPPLPEVLPEPPAAPVLASPVPCAQPAQGDLAGVDQSADLLVTRAGVIQIDDDVPIPPNQPYFSVKRHAMQQLLAHLKPGQSAGQPRAMLPAIARAMADAHKTAAGRYTMRTNKERQTVRIWRVA